MLTWLLVLWLLLAIPLRELLLRAAGVRLGCSYLLVTVLGFSGCYEALEGSVVVIVSPELAAAYLATQGRTRRTQLMLLTLSKSCSPRMLSRATAKRPA